MKIDSTFALAALTLLGGILVFIIRSMFASKCVKLNIGWGCIDIVRDVDMEMQDIRQSPGNTEVSQMNGRSRSNTPTNFSIDFLEEKHKV